MYYTVRGPLLRSGLGQLFGVGLVDVLKAREGIVYYSICRICFIKR